MSLRPLSVAPCISLPVLLAAVLRGLNLLALAARDPLFGFPVVDAWFHASQAQQILDRGLLLSGGGAYYKGPLYSYLLAVLLALFGEPAAWIAGRVLSAAVGCCSVALVAILARRLGGDRAAWIAGLAAACWGTAIYFDGTLLLTPLCTLLLLLCAERIGAQQRPELALASAGVALGLLCITRANGLLSLIAVAAWAALASRRGTLGLRPASRAAALVLVPALVVIAPVTLRNAVIERDPVIVSWNGGINLFMGNDPAFDQASGNWHPDLSWTRLYRAPAQLGLPRGSDHQRFFLSQSVSRALDRPAEALGVIARKAALLVSAYEISNNRRIDGLRGYSPVLGLLMAHGRWWALPGSLFFPLIAAGLVLARRAAGTWLLVLLAVSWALAPLAFFNTARYRLPALLVLLPVAAAGWAAAGRPGAPRRAALVAFLLALGAVTLTIPASPTLPPADGLLEAEVLVSRGEAERARELIARAWRAEPDNPFAAMRWADQLLDTGRFEQALEIYSAVEQQRGLAADWTLAATRGRARVLAGLRRWEDSEAAYREFLAANPDRPRSGEREDFHLTDVPPIVSCEYRGELADVLAAAGRRAEAAAELLRITTDCAEAEPLVERAQAALRALARRQERR